MLVFGEMLHMIHSHLISEGEGSKGCNKDTNSDHFLWDAVVNHVQ